MSQETTTLADSPAPNNVIEAAVAEVAAERLERQAGLKQAKADVLAALRTLAVVRVEAIVRLTEAKRIQDIVAFAENDVIVDLAATEPMTHGWGDDIQNYDNLRDFVADYLSAALLHEPDPYLTDGKLTIWVNSDFVSQPIDYTARWAAEAVELQKRLQSAKVPIIKALASLGVAQVVITYDGEGDSGQINDIAAATTAGDVVDLDMPYPATDDQSTSLHEAVDELAWECLTAYHDGFENNEGGQGDITINVADGVITIDHNDRIIQLDNTTTEI